MAFPVDARVCSLRFGTIERAAIAVRRHYTIRIEEQSLIRFMEEINMPEAHGAYGIAVIRSIKRQEPRRLLWPGSPRKLISELERNFHRSRTVIGKENFS